MLFPKAEFGSVLGLYKELFCPDAISLARMQAFAQTSIEVNPESYLRFQLHRFDLWEKLVWMPYNGWALREMSGKTRWSLGKWSNALGVYVKYPNELKLALLFRILRSMPRSVSRREWASDILSRKGIWVPQRA